MIVKGTKQLGSFRKGINLYVPKREASKTNELYSNELYSNGLYGKRYVGYFNDDVNWFDTATLHGDVNQLTEINNFTNNDEGYSWQWVGYFKASSTEDYTFYTRSDDASYVWIGDNAVNGYTTANAIVNNGGPHPEVTVNSSPVSLVAGTYYPIRVQFGEQGGGDTMSLGFSTPTIAETRNGLGYYYYDPNIALVGSLLFDNQNQFLQLPRSEVISVLDPEPFTIEAWIKPTSIKTIASAGLDANGNPNGNYGDIIIGDTAGGGNNWSLQLFNNKLTFYRYNSVLGGARFFTSNTQIPLNEWTHVAVAYDGGSTLWIFVNGTLDATFGDYSRPSIQYSVITIGNLFNSGNTVWANGAYAYKGYITNLRINDNQTFYQMFGSFEPAAPLKHIFGTTLLLLANTNQPIKDSSLGNITITNVGSVTSSSQYPTVVDCSNNDAKVLMVGWPGPRPLTRVNENLYIYYTGNTPGDETLDRANSSSPWVYKNAGNEIVRSLTVSQFPWQASWPSTHTATKVCPQAPDIDNMFFPSLRLKADTGVTKFSFDYKSRIVLSGAVSGTFDATSVPTYNFDDFEVNPYDLESEASTISWSFLEGGSFFITTASITLGSVTTNAGYISYDGLGWETFGNWTTPPSISGLTNDYLSGNGQYQFGEANPFDNSKVLNVDGGITYDIRGSSGAWELWYTNNGTSESFAIATNSNALPNGAWTMLVEGVGTALGTGSAYATNPTPPTTVSSITSTVNTNYVTVWADQSGNGRNAGNNNNYGTYSLIGGKSFITFDGYSNMSVPVIWDNVSFIGTVIVVARFASTGGNIITQEGLSGAFVFARNGGGSDTFFVTTDQGDVVTSSVDANSNTNYVIGTTFNTSTASLYLNGASVGTGNVSSNAGTANTIIGGASSIAEIVVYTRVLTTEERQQVEAYLMDKYTPTAVLISGAGEDTSNGNYVWNENFVNGKRQYFFSNNELYWNGSQWIIYDDTIGDSTYSSPDLITWVSIGGTDEQAPTSTLSYAP